MSNVVQLPADLLRPRGNAPRGFEGQVMLSCLKLTNWGELFLSAFPLEAINWADSHYHRSKINAADPFKKVVKLCLDWCSQQGVKPLWREMYQQQRLQGQPADAQMYVKNLPKREEAGASSGRLGSSANSASGLIAQSAQPLQENEVLISGSHYRVLGATELEARQAAFVNNQEAMAGVDKFALLIGKQSAKDYFRRVFDNLKYEEVSENQDNSPISCPCLNRKKHNPAYICYGMRCPHRKKPLA